MKKLLLLLSLIFISLNANAGWKKIHHVAGEATLYYHTDTMEKSGSFTYLWAMTDVPKENIKFNFGARSNQVFLQVDCGPMKRYARLSIKRYEGPMGTGEVKYSSDTPDAEWTFISPDNPLYTIFKYAC